MRHRQFQIIKVSQFLINNHRTHFNALLTTFKSGLSNKLKQPKYYATEQRKKQRETCKSASYLNQELTMELRVGVMNYEWGKIGSDSEVARLYKSDESVTIDENQPYAELWMGTHPNCPSVIKSTGMNLSCLLQNHPNYLGNKSLEKFGKDLPFLFKVLSVQKALSIQVHPNKEHAVQLHNERPDLYKDPNHKPELAIALTDFKAMCGFRPFDEIQRNFAEFPEIESILGEKSYATFLGLKDQDAANSVLPKCFRNLMISKTDKLIGALNSIEMRLKQSMSVHQEYSELYSLIVKLNQQFPNDVGCFGPIFLNVLKMKPGEAVFLGANEIHAYIEGDCIECMASSDNVVRAGLTPKFKDVDTLLNMLNYVGAPSSTKLFEAIEENDFSKIFRPPVPDFAVAVVHISKGQTTYLIPRKVASIAIFVKGYAHTHDDIVCTDGTVLFIPANEEVKIVDVKEDAICYIGMTNI